MGTSHTDGGSGARSRGGRPDPARQLSEAIDQVRSMFEQRVGARLAHGDVRDAILALLAEEPMHGYQLIAEIERRSGGAWRPSAGSVYPTLQLLVDEGVIEADVVEGRKSYSLTEAGRAEAASSAGGGAPWEASGLHDLLGTRALPKAGAALAHAAVQVQRTGTPDQVEQAVTVLDEARRKLYSILAQD